METTFAGSSWPPALVYAVATTIAVVAFCLFWMWWKGRPLPGQYVFRASRLGRGNHIFPSQVVITSNSLTLFKPQWIGKLEESIHLAHVASIKIDTHLVFSDIYVETSGGQNPVVCHGHRKGDAIRIKELLEKFQTEYYGRKPQTPMA